VTAQPNPPPRRRPPWWPNDEQWPPADWGRHRGWGGGHRRRSDRDGPPIAFRIGCSIFFFALFVFVAFTAAAWIVGGIFGAITSPTGNGPLVALLVVASIAAFVALRSVRRLSAPLDELADAAERIERGDYSTRVSERGPRRMRALARAFNDMSARLATIDEQRRAFLADAAHELRTPLSIVSGQLEAIEDGLYPADAEHLAPVHEQLNNLEKLIDDMRTVALAEAGALPMDLRPIDIGAAIDHAVTAFNPEATAAQTTLTADYPPTLPRATADEQRFGQVLANLLSNALRHTSQAGHVTVSARAADASKQIEITVRDDGQGIAPDLLPHVFERFAKQPGSGGTGLGLSICRDLVEAMNGTISIDSAPGRGTTVKFTLRGAL
jgi:two-component system sensor histidine kinase BaeS